MSTSFLRDARPSIGYNSPIMQKLTCLGTAAMLLAGALSCLAQNSPNPAVDQVFADYAKPGSPGCALGVFRDGKIIYTRGYGLANLEQNVPITPQTVFDIGSTSKQFTAASILLLEKQGKLAVHDDIRKHIPELPDYGQTITILNLLNHTSGVRDYLTLMNLAGINTDSVTTDDDALSIIARQKQLNFPAGSDYLYSNSGYFLLSVIVKRVSGKTLRDFAQENIFTPLGMTHTQYRDDHTALIPNRALAYDSKESGRYALDVSYFEQTGDGAVHTTVDDLQKWDENFYSAQIGGKDFLAELQEQGRLTSGKTIDYAKGLGIGEYRGLRAVSHAGAWGGYRAQLLRFPEQHFSVACLCNTGSANTSRLARGVAEVFLVSQMKPVEAAPAERRLESTPPEPPKLSPADLAVYAGDYWSDELRVTYRLAIDDGRLMMSDIIGADGVPRRGGIPKKEFQPIAADEFKQSRPQMTLRFTRDAGGAVAGFMLDAGRTRGMAFARSDKKPPAKTR
ncbi:MAG TPA: serine hydrolase domain-containing protein [Candidatus Acidoferrales bacterium]|nr:serine hydrolase domain-containing protein [Candidatus Acidoferrales bacterium]